MRKSRAARRSLTLLKAEEVVAVEEQRDGAAPFELLCGVFLFGVLLVVCGLRAGGAGFIFGGGRRTRTTGENDIPSSWTVSLSPAWSSVGDLFGVWGVMERMKPWVHCGMRGKSRNWVRFGVVSWTEHTNLGCVVEVSTYDFAQMCRRAGDLCCGGY